MDPTETRGGGRRPRWRSVLRACAAAAVLVALGHQVARDWPAIAALRPRLDVANVTMSFLLGAGALAALPGAYVLTLRALGLYRPRHLGFYLRVWHQSYLYRYIPGKVMLVVERARLGALAGLSTPTSVLLVAWETLLLLVGAAVVALGAAASGAASDLGPYVLATAALPVLLVLGFPFALRLAARAPWFRRYLANLTDHQLPVRDQLALAVVYALVWIGLGGAFFFCCRWFVPLPLDALPMVMFWYVTGYVVGFVSGITPAGMGVREGFLALGLSGLLPAGQIVTLAVAGRLWMTVIELLWLGLVVWARPPTTSPGPAAPSDAKGAVEGAPGPR